MKRFCALNDNQWPEGVDRPAGYDDWGYDQLIRYGLATVCWVVKPWEAMGYYDHEVCDWDMVRSMGVGSLFNYFGSLMAAFGWIGVVMLVCRAGALPKLRFRLGAVGQMAFTNYIMHSVICTTIYNGHGFGLFGHVDRVWRQVLSVAIFALQLWYSPLSLQRFRFGPLEWLWRSLTYWRRQPFRRARRLAVCRRQRKVEVIAASRATLSASRWCHSPHRMRCPVR